MDGSVTQRYDSPPPHLLGCELVFTLESIVVFLVKSDEVFKCDLLTLPDWFGLTVNNPNTENLALVLRHVAAAACWPSVRSEETGVPKQLINVAWLIAMPASETGSWCLDSMPANCIYKNLKNKQKITDRTRFQLILPVPNQKSAKFKVVKSWWKRFQTPFILTPWNLVGLALDPPRTLKAYQLTPWVPVGQPLTSLDPVGSPLTSWDPVGSPFGPVGLRLDPPGACNLTLDSLGPCSLPHDPLGPWIGIKDWLADLSWPFYPCFWDWFRSKWFFVCTVWLYWL